MEKRTLLAFALSFLILLLWSLFFGPKQNQVPQKTESHPAKTSEKVTEAAKSPTTPPPSAIPAVPKQIQDVDTKAASGVEEEITVDTPLYRAVFTNVGPTISSFKLKKYHQTVDPNSPLIELVGLPKGAGDFLLFDFLTSPSGQNDKTTYRVDTTNIHLGPGSSPKDLVFQGVSTRGFSITQTYRFYPDQYRIDLDLELVNQSEKVVSGSFSADLKAIPPNKKGFYSYVGLIAFLNNKLEKIKIKKAPDEKTLEGTLSWIAYEDDYFLSAVIPSKGSESSFKGRLFPSGVLHGTYLAPSVSIHPSERASFACKLYFGPRELTILKNLGAKLDKAVNFGWTDIIAKPLLYILRFFDRFIGNYGVSIILLTVLIKILFWPLTHKSYKSMKEMQKLQPRLAKIREKYKDNREQMNKEMMALYRTYKVNPMGGCLPMIIQIPVFFALYRILGNSIELRHAPFMLWINDLSAPDRLFHFSFKIPFMAPPYGIPILTLMMGASMFIQQKMTPTPGDPTQAKFMMFLPLIFTFMFINFPSGLVLYWLVNNLLSIGQQYRIHKSSA